MQPIPPAFNDHMYRDNAEYYALPRSFSTSGGLYPPPYIPQLAGLSESPALGQFPGACMSSSVVRAQDELRGEYQAGYGYNGSFLPPQELSFPNTSSFTMAPAMQPSFSTATSYPEGLYGYTIENEPYLPLLAQPTSQTPWLDGFVQPSQSASYRRRNVAVPCTQARQLPSGQRNCPFCDYTQKGRRAQDLRRHIATHTRPTEVVLWSCCGVPRWEATKHQIPEARVNETDAEWVGGCGQPFSRRDALQRHLRERKGRCFGDASADWHQGNTI